VTTWILLPPVDDPRLSELGWPAGPMLGPTGTWLGLALARVADTAPGRVVLLLNGPGSALREAAALREAPSGLDLHFAWVAREEDWMPHLEPWIAGEVWWWDLARVPPVDLVRLLAAAGPRPEPGLRIVSASSGAWTGLARTREAIAPDLAPDPREACLQWLSGLPGRFEIPEDAVDLRDPDVYRRATLERLPSTRHVGAGSRVHPSAHLQEPVWLEPGVTVGPDARLGPHVLVGAGACIGRGAVLRETLVGAFTRVGPGTTWHGGLLGTRGSWQSGPVWAHPDELAPVPGLDPRVPFSQRAIALMALTLLSPLLALVALAIWLDDPGPVLFTQLRAGGPRLGRTRIFPLFKFRTMRLDAERLGAELRARQGGTFVKPRHDPRITRLGSWLRRTSLDELPQLLNVVRGELRLVGNRPLPLYEARELLEPWQRKRFEGPAGITGLWQTHGRSDLDEVERLALDALYATGRDAWWDLRLLLRTLPALLRRRGAR